MDISRRPSIQVALIVGIILTLAIIMAVVSVDVGQNLNENPITTPTTTPTPANIDKDAFNPPNGDIHTQCSDGVVCYYGQNGRMWCTRDCDLVRKYCPGVNTPCDCKSCKAGCER